MRRVSAILVWRRGRHTNVPRPAPFWAGGARSRGQFRRAIAPDRGCFGAVRPTNFPCARAMYVTLESQWLLRQ